MNEMSTKTFAVKLIQNWFHENRMELDYKLYQAEELYEQIKSELVLFEQESDREMLALLLNTFLEEHYSDPVNQVCFEIVQENEYSYSTSEMKKVGFFYTEEMESLILQVKHAEWFKEFPHDDSLLENEAFKQKVRDLLDTYWNDKVGMVFL